VQLQQQPQLQLLLQLFVKLIETPLPLLNVGCSKKGPKNIYIKTNPSRLETAESAGSAEKLRAFPSLPILT
jgi:hypothetical protein